MSNADLTIADLDELALQVGVKEHGPMTRNWSFEEKQLVAFAQAVRDVKKACPELTGNINVDANILMGHDPEKSLLAVIRYMHDGITDVFDTRTFLRLWFEGDFSSIQEAFPDFKFE